MYFAGIYCDCDIACIPLPAKQRVTHICNTGSTALKRLYISLDASLIGVLREFQQVFHDVSS